MQKKTIDEDDVNVTAKTIIEKAKFEDDLVPAASIIYSNVEENLIYIYKLEHRDKYFIMPYEEYKKLGNKCKINGHSVVDKFDKATKKYVRLMPKIIEKDEKGAPYLVECPPVMRFIKVGMKEEKAVEARRYWTILNKLRHRSPENEELINSVTSERGISRKELLLDILQFFKEEQLYTKD